MDDLITKKNVMPGSLFITDVKTSADVSSATIGGFGRIFKGEHKGQPVAMKLLSTRKSVSSLLFLPFIVLICSTRVPSGHTAVGKH